MNLQILLVSVSTFRCIAASAIQTRGWSLLQNSFALDKSGVTEVVRGAAIPNKLVFNYKVNLLENPSALPAHAANVKKIVAAHPGAGVAFFDDDSCHKSIARVHSDELASHFDTERQGKYKSDLCRLATLYESGGLYFDTDIEPVGDVRKLVPKNASLVTVLALGNRREVFQAILGAAPGHPVLREAMDGMLARYRAGTNVLLQLEAKTRRSRSALRWLGPEVLAGALRRATGLSELRPGRIVLDPKSSSLAQVASSSQNFGEIYLYEEHNDEAKYGLKDRGGSGCCCNVFVADETQAVAWSRFVGASEYCM